MKALHHWGVVIRWQDKAKTEADFVRTRDRYQLTSEAADLHRWLRRKIDEDGVATSAAAFAPAVIADRLDDTLLALAERDLLGAARAWAQWFRSGAYLDEWPAISSRAEAAIVWDLLSAVLAAAAGAEPLWLTWRSLASAFGSGDPDVYVCENPSVLIAAADRLGRRCLPLVCTNGRPSAAARRLLAALAGGGAVLHVRADEDSAGRQIVSGLNAAIPGTCLWRYSLEPSPHPRYEEQDLELLLRDLDRG